MPDNLSGRAAEFAHLNDLIRTRLSRTRLSLADAVIPLLSKQLHALATLARHERVSKVSRGDWIRTSDLYVPNVALEPG